MTDLQRLIEAITPEDLIDPPPLLRDLIEFLQAEFDKRDGVVAMDGEPLLFGMPIRESADLSPPGTITLGDMRNG